MGCGPGWADLRDYVGARLKKGAIVVYESAVYPGATEEFRVPLLEKSSGLAAGRDFAVGYSPERINSGDRARQNHITYFQAVGSIVALGKRTPRDARAALARKQAGLVRSGGRFATNGHQSSPEGKS